VEELNERATGTLVDRAPRRTAGKPLRIWVALIPRGVSRNAKSAIRQAVRLDDFDIDA